MSKDFFYLSELSRTVHICDEVLRRIKNGPDAFPAYRVGCKNVIPKRKFFKWYLDHVKDGSIERIFTHGTDHTGILRAHEQWLKETMGMAIKEQREMYGNGIKSRKETD